jgi:hypothetical protein
MFFEGPKRLKFRNHHIQNNMDHGDKGQIQNPHSSSNFCSILGSTFLSNFDLFPQKESYA